MKQLFFFFITLCLTNSLAALEAEIKVKDANKILDIKYWENEQAFLDQARRGTFATITSDKICDYILVYGKDINVTDEGGMTALMLRADSDAGNAINDMKILLSFGANPNIQDKRGRTALMHASTIREKWLAGRGWRKIELLIQYGANPYIKNNDGKTLFQLNTFPETEVLKIKPAQELIYNALSCAKEYALQLLLRGNPFYLAACIDAWGISVNSQCSLDGVTALISAAKHMHNSSILKVSLLLKRNAELDIQDKFGMTALLYAGDPYICGTAIDFVVSTRRKIAIALLDAGANPEIRCHPSQKIRIDTPGYQFLPHDFETTFCGKNFYDLVPLLYLERGYGSAAIVALSEELRQAVEAAAERKQKFFPLVGGLLAPIFPAVLLPLILGYLEGYTPKISTADIEVI